MKILALGSGFKITSVDEICLARGVEISAYVSPDSQQGVLPENSPVRSLLGRIARNIYYRLGPKSRAFAYWLFGKTQSFLGERFSANLNSVANAVRGSLPPLQKETMQVDRVIPLSDVPKEDFDFVVIGHPDYEYCRSQLRRMGVPNDKILSLARGEGESLKKLGPVKFLLNRKIDTVTGRPRRRYDLVEIERKVVEDVPSPVPQQDQYQLVEQLIKSCRLAFDVAKDLGRPYAPGENWGFFIQVTRPDFRKLIDNNSVPELTQALNNCLRNWLTEGFYGGQTIFPLFSKTLYEHQANNLSVYHEVWSSSLGEAADISKLAMPPIGNPWGFSVRSCLINAYCFLSHYRASFIANKVRSESQRPVVAEIGGGMGLLAYYLMNTRKDAVYIDFDLPESLFVASYYLSMAFPDKRILYFQDEGASIDQTIIDNYDIILMPNFMLPKLASLSVDVFVNTISLSEMDYDTIAEYITQIERTCKDYFYHENLANFDFSYKNYPIDFFPVPKGFDRIFAAPSRWPCFSFTSPDHKYLEILYKRSNIQN